MIFDFFQLVFDFVQTAVSNHTGNGRNGQQCFNSFRKKHPFSLLSYS